jgi:hypothetical protein
MVKQGKLRANEPYVRVATDGRTVTLSGEVASEAERQQLLSTVASMAGDMEVLDAITVTALVQEDTSLSGVLAHTVRLQPGTAEVYALRPAQVPRRGLVHAIYSASGSNHSIDQERAVLEVRKLLEMFPACTLEVVGHTDNTGAEAANQKLSVQRAQELVTHLQAATGVPKERWVVRGAGSKEPIAENATEPGRAKNRRVDVRIASYE